jgi:hypothetical protein
MIRSEKIDEIVEEVLNLMKVLKDSECMDSRVKMIKDLNLETSDICIVGMSGWEEKLTQPWQKLSIMKYAVDLKEVVLF